MRSVNRCKIKILQNGCSLDQVLYHSPMTDGHGQLIGMVGQ